MPSNGNRFTQFQKDYLKQLIVECEVQRFTIEESMKYVKEKLKEEISVEHFYYLKRQIKKGIDSKLNYLRRNTTAFIDQLFFKRVAEIEALQKEAWRLYNDNASDGHLQKDCLKELHQLTVTLATMYDALPRLTGISFINYNGEKSISEFLARSTVRQQQRAFSASDPRTDPDYKPVV